MHIKSYTLAYIIILLIICHGTTMAQIPNVRKIFEEAPQEVIPTLGDVEKSNLLKSYDEHMQDAKPMGYGKNLFGSDVILYDISATYLHIALDEVSELQLKLLPYKDRDFVIMMVATSLLEPNQSVIIFYDNEWNRINLSHLFTLPKAQDFFIKKDDFFTRRAKEAFTVLGMLNYKITAQGSNNDLIVRLTSFDVSPQKEHFSDVINKIKSDGITYHWSPDHGFAIP